MAEHFPVYFPSDARRAFSSDELVRRVARVARWSGGSRLLELCGSSASVVLARDCGCAVTAIDSDDAAVQALTERVKGHSLTDRIVVRRLDFGKLPFQDGEFEGVLVLGRVPLRLSSAVQTLRRHLAPRGRLVMTYPVKVGRYPLKSATDFWEKKLGEPLLLPREVLQLLEKAGYEPEGIETLNDSELDDFYRDLEPTLSKVPSAQTKAAKALMEELALHRSQGGKASVSLGLLIARRKEAGEKPPASRDSG